MTPINKLKQYGFRVTPELERILKKLPADIFNQMSYRKGERKAVIWCDKENKTDIIIIQHDKN